MRLLPSATATSRSLSPVVGIRLDKAGHRSTRRAWICGVCAGAVAATAGLPSEAPAADHRTERNINKQVYDDLRNKGQIIDDSPYYPVVRDVGERIAWAAQPVWWTTNFIIVKGKDPNAMATPGGNIYVNEALLKNAGNQDELANVLGHEMAHNTLNHVMNRLNQAIAFNIAFAIWGIFARSPGAVNNYYIASMLANYGFLNFSRQQEYQADHDGAILTAKAGHNPWAMIWFFEKLEKAYGPGGFEQYVQDHPATKDRVSRLEAFLRSKPQEFGNFSTTEPPNSAGLPLRYDSDTHLELSGM